MHKSDLNAFLLLMGLVCLDNCVRCPQNEAYWNHMPFIMNCSMFLRVILHISEFGI